MPAPKGNQTEEKSEPLPDWLEPLCERIASGEGINEITADDDMPSERTVYYWQAKNPSVCSRIARAREAQQDYEADNIIKMADAATAEDWQVVKLRIWARQWRASKLAPKKYGDKLDVNNSGEMALNVNIMRYGVDNSKSEQEK